MRALIARSAVALISGVLLVASTFAIGAPHAAAAPVLTATPNSGLTDGQLITITASGLSNHGHYVMECDALSTDACEIVWHHQNVGDTTMINKVIRARATVMHFDGTVHDCRTGSCVLAVVETSGSTPVFEATVPLSFDPAAALQPIPDLTVTPNTNVTFQQQLHATAPAYLNPDDTVLMFVCGQLQSSPPNVLFCSVVSEEHVSDGSGALDTTYTFNPNADSTNVNRVTSGTCLTINGCGYVAAYWGSFNRMLLAEVRSPGAVPPTTTTAANPTASTSSTTSLAPGSVVATPRFTG